MLQELIASEFKKIVTKAIKRYAEINKVDQSNVQLRMSLKEPGQNQYSMYIGYKNPKEQTFNQLLGIKIDLLQRAAMVEPRINFILNHLERHVTNGQANVFLSVNQGTKQVEIYLYDGTVYLKMLSMEEITNIISKENIEINA